MFNRIRSVRKRWLVVTAVVALLAIGLVSGAAFAANSAGHFLRAGHGYDHGYGHGSSGSDFDVLGRVAEIINVEKSTLESAFATAHDERADARFTAYVNSLVTDETLTQEQADAATTWFDARPANSGSIAIRLAATSDSDRVDDWLARLVEHGKLTQDEADALATWHDNRPDALPEVERSGSRRHKGGQHKDNGDGDDSSSSEGTSG